MIHPLGYLRTPIQKCLECVIIIQYIVILLVRDVSTIPVEQVKLPVAGTIK